MSPLYADAEYHQIISVKATINILTSNITSVLSLSPRPGTLLTQCCSCAVTKYNLNCLAGRLSGSRGTGLFSSLYSAIIKCGRVETGATRGKY